MSDSPKTTRIRALDVVPYHWALWCCVAGSDPFANEIVHAKWSEDGRHIWFMLDSHNFLKAEPTEELDLIQVVPAQSAEFVATQIEQHRREIASRPMRCAACGHVIADEVERG